MKKTLSASGANAIRTILKNKGEFHFDLRSSQQEDGKTTNVYDVFYENAAGTFTIVFDQDEISVAALNLSLGKVINLHNDANIRKLAQYVLDNTK